VDEALDILSRQVKRGFRPSPEVRHEYACYLGRTDSRGTWFPGHTAVMKLLHSSAVSPARGANRRGRPDIRASVSRSCGLSSVRTQSLSEGRHRRIITEYCSSWWCGCCQIVDLLYTTTKAKPEWQAAAVKTINALDLSA
jgi:hypothetical protein